MMTRHAAILLGLVLIAAGCDPGEDPADGSTSDGGVLDGAHPDLDGSAEPDGGSEQLDGAMPRDSGGDGSDGDAGLGDGGAPSTDAGAGLLPCTCGPAEVCADGLCVPDVSAGAMQRMGLTDVPSTPRIAVSPTRTWPADPATPEIAVWRDDALGALSISIDDNIADQHAWWSDTAMAHSIRLTWFVTPDIVGMTTQGGTWDGFRALAMAGHSIQTAGIGLGRPMPSDWDAYFASASAMVEAEITTEPVDVIGYNYGVTGDRTAAARHYFLGRGVRGGVNRAGTIDYLNLRSTSRGMERATIDAIRGFGSDMRDARGWFSVHYHFLNDAEKATVLSQLAYLDTVRDDVWIDTYRDIGRYGQERDTARLVMHEATADHIVFSVTDEMLDSRFDYPLTVKVRLPDGWSGVRAWQGGSSTAARVITHAGSLYALVDAVPDRGPVVLRAGP